MTSTQVPAFVAEKRARKAALLAGHCVLMGIDADAAARLSDDERREVEVAGGVKHKGSDRTWRSVVEMLAGSTMPGALCLTCGLGDPEGVDGPPKPYGHQGPCAK